MLNGLFGWVKSTWGQLTGGKEETPPALPGSAPGGAAGNPVSGTPPIQGPSLGTRPGPGSSPSLPKPSPAPQPSASRPANPGIAPAPGTKPPLGQKPVQPLKPITGRPPGQQPGQQGPASRPVIQGPTLSTQPAAAANQSKPAIATTVKPIGSGLPASGTPKSASQPAAQPAAKPPAPTSTPAPANQPTGAATVELEFGDVIARIPSGFLKSGNLDSKRKLHFSAAELLPQLSKGRAVVSLASIASQCSDLFEKAVPEGDLTEVHLPLPKLVQQIGQFDRRADQEEEELPAEQFDTPFLKAAIASGDKGMRTASEKAPVAAASQRESASPAAKAPAPATKPAVPAGAPSARTIPGPGLNLAKAGSTPAPAASTPPAKPAEPVAKSPNSLPAVTIPVVAPVPIKPIRSGANLSPSSPPPAVSQSGMLELPLINILRALPVEYVQGNIDKIDEHVMVRFPLQAIMAQLPRGRVSFSVGEFKQVLESSSARIFADADDAAQVPLPLQEVLARLPKDVLTVRPDQVVEELGEEIATPFGAAAREDAARLGGAGAAPASPKGPAKAEEPVQPVSIPEPVAPPPAAIEPPRVEPEAPKEAPKPVAAPEPVVAQEPEAPKASKPASAGGAGQLPIDSQIELQELFATDQQLDVRSIVALASKFPGIAGCIISSSDGLNLAGPTEPSEHLEALSAIAPHFFRRIGTYASELKLGDLQSFTLQYQQGYVSMFLSDDICMSVLHQNRDFLPGIRERFLKITRVLASMYKGTSSATPSVQK